MAAWCLTKQAEEKLLKALREDGSPQKMVDRGTEGRLRWFEEQVGKENAPNLNKLFEEKMLLKSQVNGFKSFVKRLGGPPRVQRDFLSKVERLNKALSKKEVDQYLESYVQKRLNLEPVTENQFKIISETADKIQKLSEEFNIDGVDLKNAKSNKKELWKSEESARLKGSLEVELYNLAQEIADGRTLGQIVRNRGGRFKEEFVRYPVRAVGNLILDAAKETADVSVSLVASLDNSLFGRQAIFTLMTGHPKLWARNFVKSFKDIGNTFRGKKTTDTLLADLYSDPLYMNGEYKIAKIIDTVEEQYPTSLPGRLANIGKDGKIIGKKGAATPIRLFGKAFEASEAAFTNGSLRMRTELYTMLRNAKIDKGIEMTAEEIAGTGKIVNSLLARGDLGRANSNPIVRLMLWAPKMIKADLDVLTAHSFSDIPRADRITATRNLANIIVATAVIETVAKVSGQDTELDPRSSDFLEVNGIGFLRGAPALIVLASRIATGEYKTKSGEVKKYDSKWGALSRFDAIVTFLRGKAPPATGAVYDLLEGQDYEGKEPTFSSILLGHGVAISMQNLLKLSRSPSMDNLFGWAMDFIGFNTNLNPSVNAEAKVIPEKTVINKGDLLSTVEVYSKALNTDPETAFNRFFTGQKIMQVSEGGIIVVSRQDVEDSQQFKKDWAESHGGKASDIKEVRLDHIIPNKLGGEEKESNWAVVSTSVWSSNTKVENTLIQAVKDKKLTLKEAQDLMRQYKRPGKDANGYMTEDPDKALGEEIVKKYK